jgi:large subunit ribosomal protein L9
MKVVFLEDVKNVAKAGDIKEVADGYARNYLLPRKLALLSQPGAASAVKEQIAARAETEQMKKLAAEIDGKEIIFKVKMGTKDRMHGSITAANISTELKSFTDYEVDKRKIELPETIKQLGTYAIPIKLAKGIEPKIKVTLIEKEKEPEKEPEKAEKKEGE